MSLGNPYGAMARCIMNPDLTIEYFLDINDSNKKMDGSAVDWAQVETLGQNCMVQIPKFYSCKKYDAATQAFYFAVSSTIKDTTYIASGDWVVDKAFYRDRTKACDDSTVVPIEVPYRYYGAFEGWIDSTGKLRSLPNKTPTASKLFTDFRTAAKTMGIGFTQLDWQLLKAVQMLYISEFSNPDIQTKIGRGYVDGNTAPIITGGTLSKGNNTYGETTGKLSMSYRGIEDLLGNVNEFLEGIIFDMVIGAGTYTSATITYIVSNDNYKTSNTFTSGITFSVTHGGDNKTYLYPASSFGTIKSIIADAASGFLPSAINSVDCGLHDQMLSSGSTLILSGGSVRDVQSQFAFGGAYSDASSAGLFNLYSTMPSETSAKLGSRLCV